VSTLPERLAWLLEHTRGPDGKPWSRRSLSLAAGLSASHVGQLLRERLGKRPSVDTISALAAAAGVDPQWLMTGEGSPSPTTRAEEAHADEAEGDQVAAARTALIQLGQGRTEPAARLLADLAVAGDARAVHALAEVAAGRWKPAVELLAEIQRGNERASKIRCASR